MQVICLEVLAVVLEAAERPQGQPGSPSAGCRGDGSGYALVGAFVYHTEH